MDKIKSLLVLPNLESPMNPEAAQDYKNGTWAQKAKQTTQTYAKWSLQKSCAIKTHNISSPAPLSSPETPHGRIPSGSLLPAINQQNHLFDNLPQFPIFLRHPPLPVIGIDLPFPQNLHYLFNNLSDLSVVPSFCAMWIWFLLVETWQFFQKAFYYVLQLRLIEFHVCY